MQVPDCRTQVFRTAVILHDIVRKPQALFVCCLGILCSTCLRFADAITRHDSLHTHIVSGVDDQYAVERMRETCFRKQRNFDDHVRRVNCFKRTLHASEDERMQDGIHSLAGRGIGEDDVAQSRAIKGTGGVENPIAEFINERSQSLHAGLHRIAGNAIGVYDGNAKITERSGCG